MFKRTRRGTLCAASAALVCAALAAPGGASAAAAMPGCATPDSPGGDWPSFGHDLSNTRVQPDEKLLSVGDAPMLHPVWAFSTSKSGGAGDITGTPIESNGCIYVATNQGWVFSMNADTGKLVWKAQLPRGGTSNSTVTVADRQCGTTSKRVRVRVRVKSKKKHKARHRRRGHRASAARHRKHRKKKAKYKWVWVTRKTPVRCGTVYVASTRTRAADNCPQGEKCLGPYVVAFDQASGRLAWYTPPIDTQPGADMYASPIVFDGALFVGVSGGSAELGDESDRYAFQGSYVLLDADNGHLLKKVWTIHPPKQPDDNYAGATIWSTPAIDTQDKVAYIGTGNPFKPQAESPHANAVLKVDMNRKSPHFGDIIGAYKGLVDTYYPQASDFPCYDVPGNPPPYYPQGVGSCADLDLDFGAAPNLITENGRKLVGDGQKSGVYHIFDAHTMQRVRTQVAGPPSAVGGIVGSTAFDGQSIYGPVTVPGYLWSLNSSDLRLRWIGPVGDGAHYGEPVAVANGVVYTVDLTGFLDAYDAKTGVQIAKHPLILGGSNPPTLSWAGVSVARNTVYASVGTENLTDGYVVAYKAGGVASVPGDVQHTIQNLTGGSGGGGGGGGGGSGNGSTVVAGPGATYTTYATPVVTIQKGQGLNFVNLDTPQHDVTADQKGGDGRPVFQSKLGGLGQVVPVDGVDRLASGSYGFFCSIHPGMRGTLVVR